jgi:hypothetical protein
MFTKLTALQRELMTEAARREDRLLTIPSNLRGAALARAAASLVGAGLVKEVKAKAGAPAWREDAATGQSHALKLTATGQKTVAVAEEDEGKTADLRRIPLRGKRAGLHVPPSPSKASKQALIAPENDGATEPQPSHGRARRNRRRFLAVVAGLIGLTVGALVAATLAIRAQRLAEQRTLEARSQELASEAQLRTLGQQRGTPEEGLLLAAESLRLNPSVAGYDAYENALKHLPTALDSLQAAGGVRMARYVADRRAFLTVDSDRTASLQSLDGGPVRSFTLEQRITDAAYHAERRALALASATEVAEFDVRSGATTWRRPFPSPVIALMYPKSGGYLAIVCADGSIFIHRERGEALVPIAPSGSDVSAVALSDDGARLAYGSGRPPPDLVPGQDAPAALLGFQASMTPRKAKLVIVGIESGKPEREVQFESPPTALTFDKSGQRVVAGLDEGTVALVRVSDGAILRTFANLRRKVLVVAFVDDDRVVSTSMISSLASISSRCCPSA